MVFCEIVYVIYQISLLLKILKICICQLFHQPQESQNLYIFLLHLSMTKRICLHKLHRHAFMSMRFSRSIICT